MKINVAIKSYSEVDIGSYMPIEIFRFDKEHSILL